MQCEMVLLLLSLNVEEGTLSQARTQGLLKAGKQANGFSLRASRKELNPTDTLILTQ